MGFNLPGKLAVCGVVLFVSSACQNSNPARPSFAAPPANEPSTPVSLNLIGLGGSYVGMANELCEGGAAVAIDNLKVDYQVRGGSLAGALLVACDTDDCKRGSALGTITECPLPPNPCQAGLPQAAGEGLAPACLTGDPEGTGSVRVYAARPAGAPGSWHVTAYFDSGDRTNTVSGTVDQAQEVVTSDSPMDSARFAGRAGRLRR